MSVLLRPDVWNVHLIDSRPVNSYRAAHATVGIILLRASAVIVHRPVCRRKAQSQSDAGNVEPVFLRLFRGALGLACRQKGVAGRSGLVGLQALRLEPHSHAKDAVAENPVGDGIDVPRR